ncbi:hypothetical protein [Actinomadura decatromicini]|uniref:Uncharacterized protein n=1 Tax=Actinomadura decatromicini TaxID=2604572 RepID=A0A5D3FWI8_9ACTN|nr:hypothetical protein [Actinomadura decatromicini]TYK52593.1 hypothetical protein FXF68_02135 [Actinomadura decatromicini]
MRGGNRERSRYGTRDLAHLRLLERQRTRQANDPPQGWTTKDVAGYVWVLIPFVLAGLQLFRMADGNSEIIYALTSSADTRALLFGVLVPQIPGLLILMMAWSGPGVFKRATSGMDADDRGVIGFGYVVAFALLLVFTSPLMAALASMALIGNLSPPASDGDGRRHHSNLLRFSLLGVALHVMLSPVLAPQWLPAEAIKLRNNDTFAGYVVNADQGGWTTILVDEPKQVRRVRADEIQQRTACRIGSKQSNSVWSILRRPIMRNFTDYKVPPTCPKP